MKNLADVRERLQQFFEDLALARYRRDAGLPRDVMPRDVYEHYADLFQQEILDLLQSESETDREARALVHALRRRLVFLRLDRSVHPIWAKVRNKEKETSLRLGEEGIPFLGAEEAIVREKDRNRRVKIARARDKAIGGLTSLYRHRLTEINRASQAIGFPSYYDLLRTEMGINLKALDEQVQDFLARTHDMYREVLGWLLKKKLEIDPGESEPHDLQHLFCNGTYDAFFPKENLLPRLGEYTRDMAVDIEAGGRIEFDPEDRPGKLPLPFTQAARIPDRVIFCARPGEGMVYARTLLRELGQALSLAYTRPDLPFEHRHLGDESITEAFAGVFDHLAWDPHWLKRHLGISSSRQFVQFCHAQRLYRFRRLGALFRYEMALHQGAYDGEEATAYRVTLSEACLAMFPTETYLYDLTPHLGSARTLRGWILEAMIYRHLVHYFEEDWFRNPRAGKFLLRLWAEGREGGVERVASMVGSETLELTPLVDSLEKHL